MRASLLRRLLDYYKINYDQYLLLTKDVSFDDVPHFENFPHINEAKQLVLDYIKSNKKIMIYGDYDADGVMATSILVKAFQKFNYIPGYYIPSRYLDGYGINPLKAQQIIEKGYDLVITVDNGICANEAIKLLKENNVKVIVLDHHEKGEQLPDADYIFHPTISGYGEIASSGAFVTYIFATALLDGHDKYLSTLAAISLITDMMPLIGYNRNFLRVVLSNFKRNEFTAIDYLLEDNDFDETSIGMVIGPKINAVGRVIKNTNINRLVRYFTSEDKSEILSYYEWINEQNETRKQITVEAQDKIIEALKKESSIYSIVLQVDIQEGLIGLLANKLVNQFELPCIVFTPSEEDDTILKGSARAKEGFNIVDAFNFVKNLTITSGGHALAGGITIKRELLNDFKEAFENYCRENPAKEIIKDYVDLYLNEISRENYELIKTFSPFGEAHRAPEFLLNHIKVSELTYSKDGQHITTPFGNNQKLVGFYVDKEVLRNNKYVDFIGTMRLNRYRNNLTVEFRISDILKTQS